MMGKFWPARTERRSVGRGFDGSDVGLALQAAEALKSCGFMLESIHGGHEARVGLAGDRRHEIADIIAGRPVVDDNLRAWIKGG